MIWMAQTIQPAVTQQSLRTPKPATTPRKTDNQNPCLSPADNQTQSRFALIVHSRL